MNLTKSIAQSKLGRRLRPCVSCKEANAKHELADDSGHAVKGKFICENCVCRAIGKQTNELQASEPEFYDGYTEWLHEHEEEFPYDPRDWEADSKPDWVAIEQRGMMGHSMQEVSA